MNADAAAFLHTNPVLVIEDTLVSPAVEIVLALIAIFPPLFLNPTSCTDVEASSLYITTEDPFPNEPSALGIVGANITAMYLGLNPQVIVYSWIVEPDVVNVPVAV